jgi:hypothetical protein
MNKLSLILLLHLFIINCSKSYLAEDNLTEKANFKIDSSIISDSSYMSISKYKSKDTSFDFKLVITCRGGESDFQSSSYIEINGNSIKFISSHANKSITDSNLSNKFKNIVGNIKNYKPEYKYEHVEKGLGVLDGSTYTLDLIDYNDSTKAIIKGYEPYVYFNNYLSILNETADIICQILIDICNKLKNDKDHKIPMSIMLQM